MRGAATWASRGPCHPRGLGFKAFPPVGFDMLRVAEWREGFRKGIKAWLQEKVDRALLERGLEGWGRLLASFASAKAKDELLFRALRDYLERGGSEEALLQALRAGARGSTIGVEWRGRHYNLSQYMVAKAQEMEGKGLERWKRAFALLARWAVFSYEVGMEERLPSELRGVMLHYFLYMGGSDEV